MYNESFFFFRVVDGKPEVFPVSSAQRMVLNGEEFLLIPIQSKPEPTKQSKRPANPRSRPEKGANNYFTAKDKVLEIILEHSQKGVHPLQLRELLTSMWPVALGPILASLGREKLVKRLSDGRWYPNQ